MPGRAYYISRRCEMVYVGCALQLRDCDPFGAGDDKIIHLLIRQRHESLEWTLRKTPLYKTMNALLWRVWFLNIKLIWNCLHIKQTQFYHCDISTDSHGLEAASFSSIQTSIGPCSFSDGSSNNSSPVTPGVRRGPGRPRLKPGGPSNAGSRGSYRPRKPARPLPVPLPSDGANATPSSSMGNSNPSYSSYMYDFPDHSDS